MDEHADVEPYGASHGIADPRAIGNSNNEPNKVSFPRTNCIADRCTEQESYAVSYSTPFWLANLGSQQEAIHLCAISITDAIAQQEANDGHSYQLADDFAAIFYSYQNTDGTSDRVFIAYRSVGRSFLGGGRPVRNPSSIFQQQ